MWCQRKWCVSSREATSRSKIRTSTKARFAHANRAFVVMKQVRSQWSRVQNGAHRALPPASPSPKASDFH